MILKLIPPICSNNWFWILELVTVDCLVFMRSSDSVMEILKININ